MVFCGSASNGPEPVEGHACRFTFSPVLGHHFVEHPFILIKGLRAFIRQGMPDNASRDPVVRFFALTFTSHSAAARPAKPSSTLVHAQKRRL